MILDLVAIGASLGGLEALEVLLGGLPRTFGAAVVVVQHRSRGQRDGLVDHLAAHCLLPVRDAEDKDELTGARVFVAPPDYHILVEDGTLALSTDPPVQFARPSIDVLFESAADVFGERCAGVILTGANADGAQGLKKIKEAGGLAIVQDPATAQCQVMPDAAIAAAAPQHVLPVQAIAALLAELARPNRSPGESEGGRVPWAPIARREAERTRKKEGG